MNENIQRLETKVENQGSTPQGKVSAAEWNILVAAVKALDAAGIDTETLAKYLKQYQYITTPELEELLKDVTENLDGVVDLKSAQTIEGLKDFINGFKIGGALMKYDATKKCFIFTENVLMEKGLAWNSRLEDFTEEEIFSITKAVDVDWKTIGKNASGQLYVISGGGEGGGGNYDPDFLHNYLTANKYITESALTPYATTTDVNSLLTEYLPKSSISDWALQSTPPAIKSERLTNLDSATPWTAFYTSFQPLNRPEGANFFTGITLTNTDVVVNNPSYNVQLALTYDGTIYTRYRTQNIYDSWRRVAFLSEMPTKLSQLTDDVVAGNYLSTQGGTMTGQIFLDAKGWYPSFVYMNNGERYGEIGFSAKGVAAVYDETDWRTILHSGNIGNYALPITGGTVNGNILATGNVSAQNVIVNGKTISYDADKDALIFPCNVLVERGVAWNSKIDGFDVPTITDAVSVDGVSIIREGGVLRVNPDYVQSVGGLDKNELANYLTNNKYITSSALTPYAKTTDVNSLLTDYLPKSGGTMTGQIFLDAKGWYPSFVYMNNGERYGEIGFSAKGVAAVYDETDWRTILHSGNYSDYALPKTGGTVNGNITAPKFIGALQGTADSATKLATPRSIWGQSFDGTDDVMGSMELVRSIRYSISEGAACIHVRGKNYLSSLTNNDIVVEADVTAFTGKVAIGDITATEALHVHGNILATGRIAWNSSRVLKTEIKEHYLSLDELEQIKPYSYKWKDGRDNLVHAGAIADEVMGILPETVLTDSLGIHSMDYAQTAFVMAASLTPHVSDHERRIKDLETEDKALKAEIEKLKRTA